MKVRIDQEKCIACGACAALAPEVFEFKDDGTVDVKDEVKTVDVPKDLEGKVREAADACPATAIEITEE